jgi:hypothetical protein
MLIGLPQVSGSGRLAARYAPVAQVTSNTSGKRGPSLTRTDISHLE